MIHSMFKSLVIDWFGFDFEFEFEFGLRFCLIGIARAQKSPICCLQLSPFSSLPPFSLILSICLQTRFYILCLSVCVVCGLMRRIQRQTARRRRCSRLKIVCPSLTPSHLLLVSPSHTHTHTYTHTLSITPRPLCSKTYSSLSSSHSPCARFPKDFFSFLFYFSTF